MKYLKRILNVFMERNNIRKFFTTILLLITLISCSQCDSLQKEYDIEKSNNKITVDFLSEKLYESDIKSDKLKCQLENAKVEIIKQKTLKWIAIIGGCYISSMTFLMYIKK